MSWIDEIKYHKFIGYSQTGEQGYIDFILNHLQGKDIQEKKKINKYCYFELT